MAGDIDWETEALMRRCQAGVRNLNEAHDLLADCYGQLGKLALRVPAYFELLRAARKLLVFHKTQPVRYEEALKDLRFLVEREVSKAQTLERWDGI